LIPPNWLEGRILVPILVLAAALWSFVEVAEEVVEGDSHAVDSAILMLLRTPGAPDDPLGPPWFEELVRDITALGSMAVLTLVVVVAVLFLVLADRARTALFVGFATASGTLVSTLLKEAFGRPRPDIVAHGANVYTASFPSGHSMLSAVVYLTLAALLARLMPTLRLKVYTLGVALVVVVLVGLSRIYLGVHWPSDVLAGWAAGAAWALICWFVAQTFRIDRSEPR
jgi:undecaprenyl-diphosphatase